MKNNFLFLLLVYTSVLSSQTPLNDPHWKLVWQDNFKYKDPIDKNGAVNTSIWNVRHHFDHYGEPQVYVRENVYINNNEELVLEIRNQSYSCPSNYWDNYHCKRQAQSPSNQPYLYTSGRIDTKPNYNVDWGYIEAKIKVPYGYKFFPAFWTFTGSPSYQEIDIFEMLPGRDEFCFGDYNPTHNQNLMTTNIHTQPPNGFCGSEFMINNINDYRDWHIYGLEWSSSKIIWYVDNIPVRTISNPGIDAITNLRINLSIYELDGSDTYNQSDFPQSMLIDFVKVYELNKDCNTDITLCNYDFTNHDNKVRKNIYIGNGNCSNSLSASDNVYLRASEGILIQGDFSIPLGAELYIDVNACN